MTSTTSMIVSHRNCLWLSSLSDLSDLSPVWQLSCLSRAVYSSLHIPPLKNIVILDVSLVTRAICHDRIKAVLHHRPYIQSHIFEVIDWVRQSARAQHMLEMPKKHWIALILYDSIEDMLPTFNVWYACAPNWLRVKVVHYWRRTHLKYPNSFGFKRRTGTKMHIFLTNMEIASILALYKLQTKYPQTMN